MRATRVIPGGSFGQLKTQDFKGGVQEVPKKDASSHGDGGSFWGSPV